MAIVHGKEILTGTVQLVPPKISEVVDLYLSANIATKVPQDGSIEYIFPAESAVPFETEEGCVLEVPPTIVRVSCTYSITEEDEAAEGANGSSGVEAGRVRLTARYFDQAIQANAFLSLRVPGF